MIRIRYLVQLTPKLQNESLLFPQSKITFVPMEAIAGGLGGLDISQERFLNEVRFGSYNYFAEGDLLLAKVTPCFENGKKALAGHLLNGIGFATSEVYVIRPDKNRIEPKFLLYLFSSEEFRAAGMASMTGAGGLRRISEPAILNYRLHITKLKIQKQIVDFLDKETAQIDQLISKRETFLSLIEEKKLALVNKVLDGSILGGKNSGEIGWFGILPENWKTQRVKFLFKEAHDRSETGDEELLTVSHITGVTRRSEKNVNMFMAESMEGYKLVSKSDVVVNTMWAWMGAMGVSPYDGLISPSYGVYRPLKKNYEEEYLDLIIRSKAFIAEATRRSKGIHSSRLRLYPDAFLDILFPLPNINTQREILVRFKNATKRENKLSELSRKSIDKLKELRSSLITSAVTGQLDIKQWKNKGVIDQSLDKIEEDMAS